MLPDAVPLTDSKRNEAERVFNFFVKPSFRDKFVWFFVVLLITMNWITLNSQHDVLWNFHSSYLNLNIILFSDKKPVSRSIKSQSLIKNCIHVFEFFKCVWLIIVLKSFQLFNKSFFYMRILWEHMKRWWKSWAWCISTSKEKSHHISCNSFE